jgi:hypothetical protein
VLHIRKHEVEDGKYVILFDSDHQPPQAKLGIADEMACDLGGGVYRCGMELRHKKPKQNIEDGCPGGYMSCGDCYGVFSDFWKASNDASAVHEEWQ